MKKLLLKLLMLLLLTGLSCCDLGMGDDLMDFIIDEKDAVDLLDDPAAISVYVGNNQISNGAILNVFGTQNEIKVTIKNTAFGTLELLAPPWGFSPVQEGQELEEPVVLCPLDGLFSLDLDDLEWGIDYREAKETSFTISLESSSFDFYPITIVSIGYMDESNEEMASEQTIFSFMLTGANYNYSPPAIVPSIQDSLLYTESGSVPAVLRENGRLLGGINGIGFTYYKNDLLVIGETTADITSSSVLQFSGTDTEELESGNTWTDIEYFAPGNEGYFLGLCNDSSIQYFLSSASTVSFDSSEDSLDDLEMFLTQQYLPFSQTVDYKDQIKSIAMEKENDATYATNPLYILKDDGTVWEANIVYDSGTTFGSEKGITCSTPVQVAGLSNIEQIEAGSGFLLALDSSGDVYSRGYNYHGELGLGTSGANVDSVSQITALSNIYFIESHEHNSFALKNDGTLWSWGYSDGALGYDASETDILTPQQIPGLSNVTYASCFGSNTFGIPDVAASVNSSGDVYFWMDSGSPQKVDGISDVEYVLATPGSPTSDQAAILWAVKTDGSLWKIDVGDYNDYQTSEYEGMHR